jgi:hypothetical protein
MKIKDLLAKEATFEVISYHDDAIEMTNEEYQPYLKSLDVNVLKLSGLTQPTIYKCVLPNSYEKEQRLKKNVQEGFEAKNKHLETMMDAIKEILMDITVNGDSIVDRNASGKLDESVWVWLSRKPAVCTDIFQVWFNKMNETGKLADSLKKS